MHTYRIQEVCMETLNPSRIPQNSFQFTSFPYWKFPFPKMTDVAVSILTYLPS